MSANKNVLLLGGFGSGKSTLLSKAAKDGSSPSNVPVRDVNVTNQNGETETLEVRELHSKEYNGYTSLKKTEPDWVLICYRQASEL